LQHTEEVKLIQAGDCCLAFDVNSGSLHELDTVAWNLLRRFQDSGDWPQSRQDAARLYGPEQVNAAAAEVEALHEAGRLFTPDPGWESYAPGPGPDLKALCLNVSHDCNMSCGYCFVPGQVRTGREIMPERVIRAALDFLLQSSGHRRLAVDFFGGEPLLNWAGIREGAAYALDRGPDRDWKFTLTTNTLLFDEDVLSFTLDHNFSLVLSCDGRPEIHDTFRRAHQLDGRPAPGGHPAVSANGVQQTSGQERLPNDDAFFQAWLNTDAVGLKTGHSSPASTTVNNHTAYRTSEIVARRLQDYFRQAAGQEHYVRGTYTRRNLDFTEDVRYLAGLGARSISLEPVVADAGQSFAIRDEDIPGIREEYFRLARFLRDRERDGCRISFYHFQLDLPGGPCAAKRLTGCGAGYQYLAVTPDGALYPCHQFIGHPEYCLGDLDRGITRPDIQEQFRQAHVFAKPACRSCWARFLCGGGCHAQAALQNGAALPGDLRRPYPLTCKLVQARLEGALYYLALGRPSGSLAP
jgi:uncharacterized protein